jgi:hypothetical protein
MRAYLLVIMVAGTMIGCGSKPPPPAPVAPAPAPAPTVPKADPSDARLITPSDNPSKDTQVDAVKPDKA